MKMSLATKILMVEFHPVQFIIYILKYYRLELLFRVARPLQTSISMYQLNSIIELINKSKSIDLLLNIPEIPHIS